MKYLADLQKEFEQLQNSENASKMEAYMKNKFPFLGIKAPDRNVFLKDFIAKYGLPETDDYQDTMIGLWSLPYREYQYVAVDLAIKLYKKPKPEDVLIFEYMLEYKQWWDTADAIASNLIGKLFKQHDHIKEEYLEKWIYSDDMWLNRTAILFQLKYKDKVQTEILTRAIEPHRNSSEFFHQKAIGWALRQYSKYNPAWVRSFIDNNQLAALSIREASKYL